MTTKIQWKKLQTHDGSAAEVPAIVESLLAGAVDKHTLELEQLFINDGQTCSAAGPTLELLLSGVTTAAKPEWALRAAANVAGGDLLRAWLRKPESVPDEIGRVFQEYRAQLWTLLEHPRAEVRSATAFLLGGAPAALVDEASERLVSLLAVETEATVTAGCLLALSRLGLTASIRAELGRFAAAPARLVRGAVAVAQLRAGASITDVSVVSGVVDWLSAAGDVSAEGFWWWVPTCRFASLNTFFESRQHHAICLAEMAKAEYGARELAAWSDFMLAVPTQTDEGTALRGAGDFLRYVHGMLAFGAREIATPEQLLPEQRALAIRLEQSPLCPEAGHGVPASGAVRSRWLGHSEPSVIEQLQVAAVVNPEGKPGKVPLYWAKSRRVLGEPAIPELDALVGFDAWRVLVSEAFGEYSPNWVPPTLAEIDTCMAEAIADPRMAQTISVLTDECAARVREFRRQRLSPKYWALSVMLLVRPLVKHGIAWKPAWESLITMDGDPDAWVRELVEWIPPDVRERWLWDNLVRLRFEVHYVDLLPSARLVKRSLLSIHNTRKAGRQLLASTLQLEQTALELSKTNPVFAQAVSEVQAEVGQS